MKRPPWKKIEEDRARPCTRVFRSLSSYTSASLSCTLAVSLSFSPTETSTPTLRPLGT